MLLSNIDLDSHKKHLKKKKRFAFFHETFKYKDLLALQIWLHGLHCLCFYFGKSKNFFAAKSLLQSVFCITTALNNSVLFISSPWPVLLECFSYSIEMITLQDILISHINASYCYLYVWSVASTLGLAVIDDSILCEQYLAFWQKCWFSIASWHIWLI